MIIHSWSNLIWRCKITEFHILLRESFKNTHTIYNRNILNLEKVSNVWNESLALLKYNQPIHFNMHDLRFAQLLCHFLINYWYFRCRGFETQWDELVFSIYLILPATLALGFTQPLTETHTSRKNNVSGESRPVHRDDNLTAICEKIV
jgi:hypothetical protein